MFANAQRIDSVSISAGGSGYLPGDRLVVATDSMGDFPSAQLKVTTTNASGAITGVSISNYGGWMDIPASSVAPVGGSGSGAQLALTFSLYWQSVGWVVPSAAGVEYLLKAAIVAPVSTLSDGATDRTAICVRLAVQKIRGAIANGRKTPLSIKAASVPPEAEGHAYALSVQMLAGSNPSLSKYVVSEAGSGKTALATMIEDASKWLEAVRGGKAVEYPSDPDPVFAGSVREGAMSAEEDLSTFSAPNYFNTPNDTGAIGQP